MKRIDRLVLLTVCAVTLGGCYKLTPVATPERGMEVRAQLETEAAVRRSSGMDDPIVRYEGTIVDVTPEMIALDVLVARSTSAFQDVEIRDTVRLQRAEVRSIEQRTLSPLKSALFAVGAGAAAFGIVKGIDSVVGGTGDDDGNGGTPTFRIPLIAWTGLRALPAFLTGGYDP